MSSAESAYLFRHALVRDAAYDLQPPGDRAILHALVLEIVESIIGSDDPILESWAAELAEHAHLAQALRRTAKLSVLKALAAKEVKYLLLAQRHAMDEYQNDRAIAYGLRIGDHPAADHVARLSGLIRAGEVLLDTGAPLKARDLFVQGREAARQGARLADEGRALRAIGISYARSEGREAAEPWVQQALEMFERANDRPGVGLAQMSLALLRAGNVPPDETLAEYEGALAILTETGHANGQAATLNNMGNLHRMQGRYEQAENCMRRAIAIHRERHEPHMESTVLSSLAALLAQTGRAEEADRAIDESIRLARETGSRGREGSALLHGALGAFNANRWDDADRLFKAAYEASAEVGDAFWQGVILMNHAVLYEEQGNIELAERTGQRAQVLLKQVGATSEYALATANLANLAARRGDLARARELYEQALPGLSNAQRSLEGIHRGGYAVLLKRLKDKRAVEELEVARELLEQFGSEKERARLERDWSGAGPD